MKRYTVYRNDETPYYTYYGKSFNSLQDAKKFRDEENFKWISKFMIIHDNKKNVDL